jgi:quinol monooxygenase YgiN
MHGVIVQIQRPADQTKEALRELIESVAPRFRQVEGLTRKYFLLTDTNKIGGVYFFESLAKADAFFTPAWRQRAQESWGADPEVLVFEVPIVINGPAYAAEDAVAA